MKTVVCEERNLSFFEKYLTLWVIGCIGAGIAMGKLFQQVAVTLAAALVAFEKKNAEGAGLIDDTVLYSIFMLVIITVIVGTILTERFSKRIVRE